jgi:hypothetical protein
MLPSVVGRCRRMIASERRADLTRGVGPHSLLRLRQSGRPGRDGRGEADASPNWRSDGSDRPLPRPSEGCAVDPVRCRITASLRASATFARLPSIRWPTRWHAALWTMLRVAHRAPLPPWQFAEAFGLTPGTMRGRARCGGCARNSELGQRAVHIERPEHATPC